MNRQNKADTDVARDGFPQTQWTAMEGAAGDGAQRAAMLETLGRSYWGPIFAYLVRRGHNEHQARDLAQGFFVDVVMSRDLLGQARRERGRFRTLLLTALNRYVTDVHRRERAKKRSPTEGVGAIFNAEGEMLPHAASGGTPQQAFDRAWARSVLREALAQVRADLVSSGREAYWQLFEARVVEPILSGGPPPGLDELCARLGIEDATRASNIVVTVKRRFRATLRQCIREQVSDGEVDDELRTLMSALTGR